MKVQKNVAVQGYFHGEPAIWLRTERYEAAVLPEVGANLIALRDLKYGYALLREPAADEMSSFKSRPVVHGIPVLYPPNRFEDGKFRWEGKTYRFPINEPARNNHLHGFVFQERWQVEQYCADELASTVTLSLSVDESHPIYETFPHSFTMILKYELSAHGLWQHMSIRNDGKEKLPCLLAFHTAINAPFVPDGHAQDYRVKLTIGERWELDERMLPTGKRLPLSESEQKLKDEGIYPFFTPLDHHFTASTQNGRNRMELIDQKHAKKLIYDVDAAYKQWMLFNNFAEEGFFCAEPQVNLINAPNVQWSGEEIGLYAVLPGEQWDAVSRIYLVDLAAEQ